MAKLIKGVNDLATLYPELAKEWNYEKNEDLKPEDVTCKSGKRIWWKCSVCGYEWKTTVANRTGGNGCKICAYKKRGEQSIKPKFGKYLVEKHKELVKEWNYEKNGDLKPEDVACKSGKKVWWKCSKGHEWEAVIADRVRYSSGCPYCNVESKSSFSEQAIYYYIKKYFSDAINRDKSFGFELDVYIPSIKTAIEYDGVIWHKNNCKDLYKNKLCEEKGIRLIRIREKGCPDIKGEVLIRWDYSDTSLEQVIYDLLCLLEVENFSIDISKDKANIYNQYQHILKENSLAVKYPELAKEWHPTKNGNLKPENITCGSGKKVWWKCDKGHEWEARVESRTISRQGCPHCSGNAKKKVLCIETNIIYESISEVKRKTGCNTGSISNVCRGKQMTSGGYHWKYVD